ncbi:hypothetical protein PHLGIDRAFT_404313 [Phlebiopsis gigantea 11061_1 CR5-6]|uniref:Uncharacterized protein n=1 Tax=Phlebiopsis gigantea (strain 11061_1 CR5-6) TaxID=745531 RepID=A0A0C3PMQ5_PHLG1|nr:hypothetical protein PHLGIDRAFT_404313 [Phlebiopsis gigantea 11061_1 CR5-6]
MTLGYIASATAMLFSPDIYATMKVYWLENPNTMIEEMNKLLDQINAGIKVLEEHEKKAHLGGNLAAARVPYCTPSDLRRRLSECRRFWLKFRLQLSKNYPKKWMFVANGDFTLVKRIKSLSEDIKALDQDYMATSSVMLYDEQDPEILECMGWDEEI